LPCALITALEAADTARREREKKLLVLTLGRYDVRTLGSYHKSSSEPSSYIKGHGV
jgi:hypothetical protein